MGHIGRNERLRDKTWVHYTCGALIMLGAVQIYNKGWLSDAAAVLKDDPQIEESLTSSPATAPSGQSPGSGYNRQDSGKLMPSAPVAVLPEECTTKDETGVQPGKELTVHRGTLRVPEGETVENMEVYGNVVMAANSSMKNVRVIYGGTAHAISNPRGADRSTLENVEVQLTNNQKGANSGIALRDYANVSKTEITGYGDGIKAWDNSVYKELYIEISKVPGSDKHADGVQGSGKTSWTLQRSTIENGRATGFRGGNASVFAQSFTGQRDANVENVTIQENCINGGQFLFATGDGKSVDQGGSGRDGWFNNNRFVNNLLFRDYYGARPISLSPGWEVSGNVWYDTGEPVNP